MNNIRNFVAAGSILFASGCVEGEQMPVRTPPVVTIDGTSGALESPVSDGREEAGIPKEAASDPVKILRESSRKFHDAMAVINPLIEEFQKRGSGDAQCHYEPAILEMQKKNREITERMNKAMQEAIKNGPPELIPLKCAEGQDMTKDCAERLNTELGRIFVEDKKATGEYYQALAECYQKEFNFVPAKKP